ncbi:MAG: trigger factor [bacterium]
MKITSKELPKNEVELEITLSVADQQQYLAKALTAIASNLTLPGFRPGKVPADIAKQKVGEMEIMERAVDPMIMATLDKAIEEYKHKDELLGQPKIDLAKIVPNQDFVYTARFAKRPQVKLGSASKLKVQKPLVTVDDKEVEIAIENIRVHYLTENKVERSAQHDDKAVIDFTVTVDNVVIEGGAAKDYPLVIGENRMIPGFEDNLLGMVAGEKKTFMLKFPVEYHAKQLAGKEAKFEVAMKEVYNRVKPPLDETFLKLMGDKFKTIEELKEKIKESLKHDKEYQAGVEYEKSILSKLVDISSIGELSDLLVDRETHKMIKELEQDISSQDLSFDDYLQHIKKTKEQLHKDFQPAAINRLKVTLCLEQLVKEQKIEPSVEEVNSQIEQEKARIKEEETKKKLDQEYYRQYVKSILANRKAIQWLKEKVGD